MVYSITVQNAAKHKYELHVFQKQGKYFLELGENRI